MKNLTLTTASLALIAIALLATGCAGLPKLKDFNKIEVGMSKEKVLEKLGEPKTTRFVDGREILEYEAQDGDDLKPRLVVLEDREVTFSGRPSEYKRKSEESQERGNASVTTTVSPVISPVFNNAPVITIAGPTNQPAPIVERVPDREQKAWFHRAPLLEEVVNTVDAITGGSDE